MTRAIRNLIKPVAWADLLYRCAHWTHQRGVPLLPNLIDTLSQVLTGAEIHHSAKIGRHLRLIHSHGIVIADGATIGDNCIIFQGVTIGIRNIHEAGSSGDLFPIIGDNVTIYSHAVIGGAISIGDNVTIGANAVVLHDVPSNHTVVGNPARSIHQK